MVKYMSKEYAMYPRGFAKTYKRAKQVFLSAKKDAREHEEAQMKFERLKKGGGSKSEH